MHTFDHREKLETSAHNPLGTLFESVEKLEEERKAKMVDKITPPNTQSPAAAVAPAKVPASLDTSKPIVDLPPVAQPKGIPIAPTNDGSLPPAQPEGDVNLTVQAANAAAVPKAQLPPTVVPGVRLKEAGKTVTMVFPHRVLLTVDHATQIEFLPGVQEVPESLADHVYLKQNRVVRYDPQGNTAHAAFAPTVPLKESPFCPECGQATALHLPPARACPKK